jgi:hypothetical protein
MPQFVTYRFLLFSVVEVQTSTTLNRWTVKKILFMVKIFILIPFLL